jgi:transposase
MGQPVEIARIEYSASELRSLAGKMKDAVVVRRLLALALVLEGHSRETAAAASGMTRQTLRDWVHRYNVEGVAGLRSGVGGGPAPLLSAAQMEELRAIVIEGPDPERHKVVRWRRIDLCEEVARRWSVTVCEQTVGRWLRQLRMTRLQPRPVHPKKDHEAEVAFKNVWPAPSASDFYNLI